MSVQQNIDEQYYGEAVDIELNEICQEMEKQYDIRFLEIETDKDHVHLL